MSVFTTKANGRKFTVVAANVVTVQCSDDGKADIAFVDGSLLRTEVGYDSVRRNVAKALSGAKPEAEAE
ncbi:hypothetical protein PP764_gp44 [Escherichia phage phi G17]|uniref:Uncharacterized protein n=1 Tax=Escherichia phage phi G17 TaxID=2234086 RepID=A0A2Z4Q0P0_9CAUD|nr:hypothetical protein PP764_gp44 [Escherichia phage phi G17]AWY03410.1 hypothetical protein [Escherichia phage phi G17]